MRASLISIILALVLTGCSGSDSRPKRVISGQLITSQFALVGAQVVAMSSSGRVYRAPISAAGSFRIALPIGSTYTVRFANSTSAPSLYDAFAVLAPAKLGGARTHWFTLTAGGSIDLGLVGRTTATATTLDDGSSSSSDSGDGAEDDGEEDDGADACDLSHGSDIEDVESEHDLLDDTDADHDGIADSSDDHDDRDACTSASDDGDDCELSDDQEHEDEAGHDSQCSTGSGSSPSPAPAPGIIG